MASLSNKVRLTIRKRAAPNILSKKVKAEVNVASTFESKSTDDSVPVQKDTCPSESLNIKENLQLCSSEICDSNHVPILSQEECMSLDLPSSEIQLSTPILSSNTDVSQKKIMNTFLAENAPSNVEHVTNKTVSSLSNITDEIVKGRNSNKDELVLSPKKSVGHISSDLEVDELESTDTSNLEISMKEGSDAPIIDKDSQCDLKPDLQQKDILLSLIAEKLGEVKQNSEPLVITKSKNICTTSDLKQLKKRCAPVLLKKRQSPSISSQILSKESSVKVEVEKITVDKDHKPTKSVNFTLEQCQSEETHNDTLVEQKSNQNFTGNCDLLVTPANICESSQNSSEEIVKSAKKISSKPLLTKRALPVLPRKRPAPNVSSSVHSNTSKLAKVKTNENNTQRSDEPIIPCENSHLTTSNIIPCEDSHLSMSKEPQQKPLKMSCKGTYEKLLNIVSNANESPELLLKGHKSVCSQAQADVHLKMPTIPLENTEDQSVPQNERNCFFNPKSQIVNTEANHSKNTQPKIIAAPKILKRRVGPKLVYKDTTKCLKISTNDEAEKGDSKIGDNAIKILGLKNEEKSECVNDENINTTLESNKSENFNKELPERNEGYKCSHLSDINSEPVANCSKNQTEGVVRVFWNCWPQYPLDDLSEDPFYEGQKIEELGKLSIFTNKKHKVVYCDMKSTVEFERVPKNWVYVNFNKLIKEEFVSPEEEMQNIYGNSVLKEKGKNQVYENDKNCTQSYNELDERNVSEIEPSVVRAHPVTIDTSVSVNCSHNNENALYNTSKPRDLSDKLLQPKSVCSTSTESRRCTELLVDSNELFCPKILDKKVTRKRGSCKKETDTKSNKAEKMDGITQDSKLQDSKGHSTLVSTESTSCKKSYQLRKKPLVCKNNEIGEFEHENVEDIFSISEDSDQSEFNVKPENNTKAHKRPRKYVKKIKVKKESKPRKKAEETAKEKRVKVEKKVKNPENPSPFKKLGIEVKNKNKWDEEGNCAEPDKLELKDFIFYVPKNVPMFQEPKKETKVNINKEKMDEETIEGEKEEEESHGPKLIVKDGKIIVDPNSTKIKQTPVFHAKVEKIEKPKEPNDPWDLQETMKFYATLWKYGIDFSMLAGTFPKKSRDSIKKKFNYEEKNNGLLLAKTLTKKLDIRAVLRELILIDSLEKVSRKKAGSSKPPKEPRKTIKRHCLLPKKKRNRNPKTVNESTPHFLSVLPSDIGEESNQSLQSFASESEIIISDDVTSLSMKDFITFSTNVVYEDMNIVQSVSFHPSAIQPVDVNVTIRHDDPPEASPQVAQLITQDTSL